MEQEKNEILKIIVKYQLLYFSIREMIELTGINSDKLEEILSQLSKEKLVYPIENSSGIYTTALRKYQFEDYLRLAQKIRPDSIVGYETALYYQGIISNKPKLIKLAQNVTMVKSANLVKFQDCYYAYETQKSKTYNLGIIKRNGILMYEAEKAYLDYLTKNFKTPYDNLIMGCTIQLQKLNKEKLFRYFKQGNYPKEYEKILIEQFGK